MTNQENTVALLPVYLFCGDDALKKKVLLERLKKRIAGACDLSFDSVVFDSNNFSDKEVFADACNTLPFIAQKRLVVVVDVDKAAKPFNDAIIDYLTSPSPTTVLVLTAEKLAKNSRLLAAINSISPKALVVTDTKKYGELNQIVRKLAADKGLNADSRAIDELVTRVGSSMLAISKELDKLATYVFASGRKTMDCDDVKTMVKRTAETSSWDFVEAVFSRSLANALELRARLQSEKPHSLLALCVMRVRDLLSVRSLLDRQYTGIAARLKRPDWQVRKLVATAQKYKTDELRQLLIWAAEYDRQMKSGSDAELVLDQFIIRATIGNR
jgi:DNA polymerase-3 subunit delta